MYARFMWPMVSVCVCVWIYLQWLFVVTPLRDRDAHVHTGYVDQKMLMCLY